MSFIEGTEITGNAGELAVVAFDHPTDGGSHVSRFHAGEQSGAYSERNTTKIGAKIGPYDPELASILGGEFG